MAIDTRNTPSQFGYCETTRNDLVRVLEIIDNAARQGSPFEALERVRRIIRDAQAGEYAGCMADQDERGAEELMRQQLANASWV